MIYAIEDLAYTYPGAAHPALNHVNLTVGEGEIVTLLGRNGAGKSTLLNLMLGLITPQRGTIMLMGAPIASHRARGIAAKVGYVPQSHMPSFSYTVLDFVTMGCAPRIGLFSRPGKRERADAEAALDVLGALHLRDRPYTEISGGERQQAMIARAIANKPRAVLFDEPTAHLDFASQLKVLRMIKGLAQAGFAVVTTTHNPDHALLLNGSAALMDARGALTQGRVQDIVTQESLREVYGEDVLLEPIKRLNRTVCVYPNL